MCALTGKYEPLLPQAEAQCCRLRNSLLLPHYNSQSVWDLLVTTCRLGFMPTPVVTPLKGCFTGRVQQEATSDMSVAQVVKTQSLTGLWKEWLATKNLWTPQEAGLELQAWTQPSLHQSASGGFCPRSEVKELWVVALAQPGNHKAFWGTTS